MFPDGTDNIVRFLQGHTCVFGSQKAGRIRSIGVSNMTLKIWDSFVPQFDIVPSASQAEYNPYFRQKAIREIMAKDNVALES